MRVRAEELGVKIRAERGVHRAVEKIVDSSRILNPASSN
jgi:hypothetical protein